MNGTPGRICIVDDDDAVRESLRLLLEAYRYAVTDFASASAFLLAAGTDACDCLVLDLHMSGMSGLELLEVLRGRRELTPAIVLTGNSDPHLAGRLEKAQVQAVLAKPVTLECLLTEIERALSGE